MTFTNVQAGLITGDSITLGIYTHNVIVDDSSGFSWLGLTQFYNLNSSDQLDRLNGSIDWQVANNDHVNTLEKYMTGNGTEWHSNFDIFGLGAETNNLSGRYVTTDADKGLYAHSLLTSYRSFPFSVDSIDPNVGLWVVNTSPSVSVPIPPTTTLLFLGSLALFANIRRRKQAPLSP